MTVMRPGQIDPSELEIALIERYALENPDAHLSVSDLRVLSRTFTVVGSYTDFLIKDRAKTGARRVMHAKALVTIPGLQNGLGTVAFLEGDKLVLELYTFGERWDGLFGGFAIVTTA
jgi:hypothetical protein